METMATAEVAVQPTRPSSSLSPWALVSCLRISGEPPARPDVGLLVGGEADAFIIGSLLA